MKKILFFLFITIGANAQPQFNVWVPSLSAAANLSSGSIPIVQGGVTKKADVSLFQPVLILTTTGTSGAATLIGSTLNIPQYSGSFLTINNPSYTGSLTTGTLGYSDTGILGALQSYTNSYNQFILQNTSNGASASTNFNISNDAGTATTNFGEFGINSSGFTGTGAFNQAGNVYLAAASTDLAIGTYANKPIHFVTNSGATDAMTISGSGTITIPSLSTGLLKSTSGAIGLATSGTDYAPATSGTSILKGNGSGGFSNATAGTDYVATESDPVVKAISGIVKSNGTTISAATAGTDYQVPITVTNGLSNSGATIKLGGALTQDTDIYGAFNFSLGNTTALQSLTIKSKSNNPINIMTDITAGGSYNIDGDPALLIKRTTDPALASNAHSFEDVTIFNKSSAGFANNAFTDNGQTIGTVNYNHHVSYQNAYVYNGSGTMSSLWGFYDNPTVTSGTVTNRYGAYIHDGTGAGTIGTQYGLYVENLTKGSTNWGVFAPNNDSSFGNIVLNGAFISTISANFDATLKAKTYFGTSGSNGQLVIWPNFAGNGELPAGGFIGNAENGNITLISNPVSGAAGGTVEMAYYDGTGYRSAIEISNTSAGANGTLKLIRTGGNVQVGGKQFIGSLTTPTALLHLAAGTATANTAPLKLTSGIDLTTAEAGAFYYNGTRLGFSPSTTIKRIALTNDASPSNGQIAIGNGTDYTLANITATGLTVTNGSGTIALGTRNFSATQVTSTDANITATFGTTYILPAATLTANRTIDMTALNTAMDYVEIINLEAGFTWSFTGQSVYFADGVTTVTNLLANTNYIIRNINGKLRIIN
jgi:hypothetical protein